MAKCEICGKGVRFGHSVSHSKHRSNRSWSPNIQRVTVQYEGKTRRMQICARCLRTLNKSK